MGPHPSGLSHPGLALGGGSSLLALSGVLGAQLAAKDERAHLEAAAAAAAAEHHRGKLTPVHFSFLRVFLKAQSVKVEMSLGLGLQLDCVLKNESVSSLWVE